MLKTALSQRICYHYVVQYLSVHDDPDLDSVQTVEVDDNQRYDGEQPGVPLGNRMLVVLGIGLELLMEHETAFPAAAQADAEQTGAAQADAEQTGAAQADEPQTDHGGLAGVV